VWFQGVISRLSILGSTLRRVMSDVTLVMIDVSGVHVRLIIMEIISTSGGATAAAPKGGAIARPSAPTSTSVGVGSLETLLGLAR
jgi:hypothetical protein